MFSYPEMWAILLGPCHQERMSSQAAGRSQVSIRDKHKAIVCRIWPTLLRGEGWTINPGTSSVLPGVDLIHSIDHSISRQQRETKNQSNLYFISPQVVVPKCLLCEVIEGSGKAAGGRSCTKTQVIQVESWLQIAQRQQQLDVLSSI